MTRSRTSLGLLALLPLAVFAANLYLPPGTFMPAIVYIVPFSWRPISFPASRRVAAIAL